MNPIKTFLAIFLAFTPAILFAQSPSSQNPADNEAVAAVVDHHVAALNSGNPKAMAADWGDWGVIVDAMSPFVWEGRDPTAAWWSDMNKAIAPAGLKTVTFTRGQWQRIFAVGDTAYAVADATAAIAGPKLALEAKGTWTFALHRQAGQWRIVSWTWGGPTAQPLRR